MLTLLHVVGSHVFSRSLTLMLVNWKAILFHSRIFVLSLVSLRRACLSHSTWGRRSIDVLRWVVRILAGRDYRR
jgi:hypothetical protein